MKIFATILLLAAGIFVNASAQTTNSLYTSHGSLELVLSLGNRYVYTNNTSDFYPDVTLGRTTNNAMEVTFRNVGETNLDMPDLFFGLTVVLDGKEYVYRGDQDWFGSAYLKPHTAYRMYHFLSDYPIPKEALDPGWHTVAVKVAGAESNMQTIFIDPNRRP